MRPINKGEAPEKEFKKYQDAEAYLENRIGEYCPFCEFPIKHVPEVEHIEAKKRGGAELEWENLLLSCKYCNTRKGTIVGRGEKGKYLWPDEDDTFHAFSYDTDIPMLSEGYLKRQGENVRERADNLFQLIKLDNVPTSPKNKDRRYMKRNEARNCAIESKIGWEKVSRLSERETYLNLIVMLARETGFFSTWMNVFKEDQEVKELLVEAFKGTKKEYCL